MVCDVSFDTRTQATKGIFIRWQLHDLLFRILKYRKNDKYHSDKQT